MTKVLGRVTSINVRKVLWALDELGEPYEREDWGLPNRDPRTPEFLALNPNAQVPVLIEDDGSSLWESNGLLVYLAQTRGRLMPEERHKMGLALQWLGWQGTELSTVWGYAVMGLVRGIAGYDDEARISECLKRWTTRMDILEAELAKGKPFIAGDAFSIADIALGLSVHRWYKVPRELKAMPAARAYYERSRSRAAGARWMPDDYG
ncbi:glutathione S-transferase family protein [Devosia sp. PTR5]|uniref:Glutathione S-transferase family protein n=1 Tax=Devosia oryzisoli TaxID=2774138 RepID=A0A927FWS4_9HYPH|nr:glutathione S-transferase family protein [Devosia oryzisoli]MBD8066952.1 glutathione S-transferase family protein [Devosia oryzisoli]